MSVNDHHRKKIISEFQHMYEHSLADLAYSHPALPNTVQDAEAAMDYAFNILYPNIMPPVATQGDLPAVGNTLRDQRVVQDDGDGKAAIYAWLQNDGMPAPDWVKVGDLDWGTNTVISGLLDQTQYLYVRKYGTTDYDPVTELPLTGIEAGQHIYGGDLANQHLTLHANNGDPLGNTGFVQFGDNARPTQDLTFDLGDATHRLKDLYAGTAIIGTGTMTITSDGVTGTITDTSGEISFGDENLATTGNANASTITASTALVVDDSSDSLTIDTASITSDTGALSFGANDISTTGTLASGVATIDSDLTLASGSITSASGAIGFGDENLSTTGTLDAGVATFDQLNVDDVRLDGNSLSVTTLDTDLQIAANGTGVVDINSAVTALGADFVGSVSVTGDLTVDQLGFDGDVISSTTGSIQVDDTVLPVAGTENLGSAAQSFNDLFMTGSFGDGTNTIAIGEVLRFRRTTFRDVAETIPAQDSDSLFYNIASGTWLAADVNTKVDHGSILGLGDDDHTQYALLAGRGTAQVLNGGDASGTLSLSAHAGTANAITIDSGDVSPSATATFDLGKTGNEFKDIYLTGQLIGARLENQATAGIVGNVATPGRVWFNTTDEFVYVNDNAGNVKKVGNNSHSGTYTNVQLAAPVDVSAYVDDARNCVWQLQDVANGNEIMAVPLQLTATTVIAANTVALPAGSYRLVGIEV